MDDPKNPSAYGPSANPANNPTAVAPPRYSHGRTGKVARLPKAVRDKINHLMLDGRTYLEIIAALGPDGRDLNEDNLASWKSGGFLEFREEEKEFEAIRVRQEFAIDVARSTPGVSLCEATAKIMIAQVLDALRGSGTTSLLTALQDKPEIYVRLLQAVARLSASALLCERHRLNEEERKAESEKRLVDTSDLAISAETLKKVDQLLRNH